MLDVGSGPGQIGAYVSDRGRQVVALDRGAAMAGLAASRLRGALVADVRSLPIATASLGGIVAFYSLIHLRRTEVIGALRELHRTLRPEGRALVSAHEGEGEAEVHDTVRLYVELRRPARVG